MPGKSMKKQLLFLYCITAALNVCGESVYTWDLTRDLIIGSAGAGASIAPFFINHAAAGASLNVSFERDKVPAFDRDLMYAYNQPVAVLSDVGLYGLMAMPLLSMAGNLRDGEAWLSYGIMYAEAVLLVYGTTEIVKNSVLRYRPYCYFDIPPGKEQDYFKSFPSRHTAFAFMSAGFASATFWAEYPDSPWKIPVSVIAYSLAAGVGAARIGSGNHFLSDVLAGAAAGSLYGYLVPWLHRRNQPGAVTLAPLPNGFMLAWKL
jgi:membrane-associated phospholipid phosphatase